MHWIDGLIYSNQLIDVMMKDFQLIQPIYEFFKELSRKGDRLVPHFQQEFHHYQSNPAHLYSDRNRGITNNNLFEAGINDDFFAHGTGIGVFNQLACFHVLTHQIKSCS